MYKNIHNLQIISVLLFWHKLCIILNVGKRATRQSCKMIISLQIRLTRYIGFYSLFKKQDNGFLGVSRESPVNGMILYCSTTQSLAT